MKLIAWLQVLSGIFLIIPMLSCEASGSPTTATTTTSTTSTTENPTPTEGVLPIKIGLYPTTMLPLGVTLENIVVTAGIWHHDQQRIIISGDLNNTTDENYYVSMGASGYDIDWEIVTQQIYPYIPNKSPSFVPREAVTPFEIVVEWTEGINYLELSFYSLTEDQYLEKIGSPVPGS